MLRVTCALCVQDQFVSCDFQPFVAQEMIFSQSIFAVCPTNVVLLFPNQSTCNGGLAAILKKQRLGYGAMSQCVEYGVCKAYDMYVLLYVDM